MPQVPTPADIRSRRALLETFRLRYLPPPSPLAQPEAPLDPGAPDPLIRRVATLELQNARLQARLDELETTVLRALDVPLSASPLLPPDRTFELLSEVDFRLSLQDTTLSSALTALAATLRGEMQSQGRNNGTALRQLQDHVSSGFERAAYSLTTHNSLIASLLHRVFVLEAQLAPGLVLPDPSPPA